MWLLILLTVFVGCARCVVTNPTRCVFVGCDWCMVTNRTRCVFVGCARCVVTNPTRCVFVGCARCVVTNPTRCVFVGCAKDCTQQRGFSSVVSGVCTCVCRTGEELVNNVCQRSGKNILLNILYLVAVIPVYLHL